jgi:hypothetical protein
MLGIPESVPFPAILNIKTNTELNTDLLEDKWM